MEFAFYYTEVTWCWWEENKRKTAQEAVVVCATSYSHAAGIVEENYGDELVSIDKIEQISEDKVLPLSVLSGRALRDAAINYGAAEIIEEKDFSKPEPPAENAVREIRWNPNKTPFPYDAPLGTVIICDNSTPSAGDSTYEGVAP